MVPAARASVRVLRLKLGFVFWGFTVAKGKSVPKTRKNSGFKKN
jgi:hypothetical protein